MERGIRTVIIMAAVCAFLLLGTCVSAAAQKPVQISTYQQLAAFIDGINDGSISADRNATLTKDITVPDSVGNDWTPLAKDSEHAYQGTFDGRNHTISGIKVERNKGKDKYPDEWNESVTVYDHTALISFLGDKGEVKNLNVVADISDVNDVAGIVSVNEGKIQGCTFQGTLRCETYPDAVFEDSSGAAGCIAAENTGTIEKCTVREGTALTRGGVNAAGIAGVQTTGVIKDCTSNADITLRETIYKAEGIYVGGAAGIAGLQTPSDSDLAVVEAATAEAATAGADAMATAVKAASSAPGKDGQPLVENSTNNGTITAEQSSGGICGMCECGIIRNCVNNGKIEGAERGRVGGITGHLLALKGFSPEVTGCVNTGSINEAAEPAKRGEYIGGIIGWAADYIVTPNHRYPVKISNCKNTGNIYGKQLAGGVFGKIENGTYPVDDSEESYVYRLVNLGSVNGENYVGGIAGACPGVILDTINYGSVNAVLGEVSRQDGCFIGGIAGVAGNTGVIYKSYNMGKVTVSGAKGAAFMEPGAIVGATTGSLTGCYFCADTTGTEVTYATCEDVSQQGLLTLQQMTGEAPKTYMADLMETASDDCTGTVWKTMADTAKAGKTYVMTPQFEGVSIDIDEILAAGVDLEKKDWTPLDGANVELESGEVPFNGWLVTPVVTEVTCGGKELQADTDYVVYSAYNNIEVGPAEVYVLGRGDYCGFAKADFTIIPAKAGIKSLKAGKKKLTVTLTGKPAKCGATKYKIQYRIKGKSSWKTITTSKAKVTIKKLKKGKKYQVRAQAYTVVDEGTLCGAWSKVKTSKKIR